MMTRAAPLLLVFLGACAHAPRPILASDVAEGKRGASLSAYLGQRDANATVCDLNARGPHLAAVNARVRDDLIDGLSDGRIPPPVWRQCVDAISRSADRETKAALFDAVRDALAKHRLDSVASRYATAYIADGVVEKTLMSTSVNRVSVDEHPVLRGWIDDTVRTARVVLVRQDVEHQTSTLVGSYDDDGVISVLPQLSLRGALHLELQGMDRPVTLCAPPEALDPSPCVPATEVSLGNPLAYLESDGTIRFVERITASQALQLAAHQERFVVPVMVHGQQLTALDWGLRFVTPNELVFAGGLPGANGPDLRIRLDVLAANRLSYTVSRGGRQYIAIVERERWRDFDVSTQGAGGASGMNGSDGRDGFNGLPGQNASCPSFAATNGGRGEDGAAGEDGKPGANGGDGGKVLVEIHASGAQANELAALVSRTVASRGGAGGMGGNGGRGGRGGSGGSGGLGATCVDADGHTTFLSGGMAGFSGNDGRSGLSGMPGSPGRDGAVTVRIVQ